MYIGTYTNCNGFHAVASKDESENEVIHRFHYVDGALHCKWMNADIGSDEEMQIERKGEQLALQKLLDEMVERKQISVSDALAEMVKFMGGEVVPEPEPTPEPEKSNLLYAVGDEVLVRAKIVRAEDDDLYPYLVRGEFGEEWVMALDIAGKAQYAAFVAESPSVKEEPKPEPVKYEVGMRVRTNAKEGIGVYKQYLKLWESDKHPHGISYNGYNLVWVGDDDIIEVVEDEPKVEEPKFKVGDKVIHKFYPDWGVGTVKSYTGFVPDLMEYFEYGKYSETYYVEFPYFFFDNEDKKRIEILITAEQNLVPA